VARLHDGYDDVDADGGGGDDDYDDVQ